MRAQVLGAPAPVATRPLELVERAKPEPRPGEVRVAVSACGCCRTDLHVVEGDLELPLLPVTPGHQVVGRVDALGAGSTRFALGDRVGVTWLHRTDGECGYCRRGEENLCESADFTGWTVDGGYAERIVAPRAFTFPIPDRFSDLEAAPLLCAGIIGYRSLRLSGIRPGGRLGLFGFGSSAHLAIQVAIHEGAEVLVFSRSQAELARAQELGASWVGGYDEQPPAPLDAAVTFAPAGSVVVSALTALAPGATVAINAIHLDRMPSFDYDLLWKSRSLRSVANFTRRDALEFLDVAARIPIRPQVQEFPLERAGEALDALEQGTLDGTAVLAVS